jgi:hypothetical protein
MSIADIACFPYCALAGEGRIDVANDRRVTRPDRANRGTRAPQGAAGLTKHPALPRFAPVPGIADRFVVVALCGLAE